MDPNEKTVSIPSIDVDQDTSKSNDNSTALRNITNKSEQNVSLLTLPRASIEELRNSSVTLYFKGSSYEDVNVVSNIDNVDDIGEKDVDYSRALDNDVDNADVDFTRAFDYGVDSGIDTLSPTTPLDGVKSFVPLDHCDVPYFDGDHISTSRTSASRISGCRRSGSHISAGQMSLKSCIIPAWFFDEDIPKKISFTNVHLVLIIISIVAYLLDVGSDLNVASLHFRRKIFWWFGLTVSFIIVPSIAMALFNKFFWESEDEKKKSWVWKILIILFQGTMLLRYWQMIRYGIMVKNTKDEQKKLEWFDTIRALEAYTTVLQLIEAFMEAAPELVLQTYIMVQFPAECAESQSLITRLLSIALSSLSLSWAVVSYYRSWQVYKKVPVCGLILQLLWRTFTIGARVVAFIIFAIYSWKYLAILIATHFVVMLVWRSLWKHETCCCELKLEKLWILYVILAFLSIFTFLPFKYDKHTRLQYVIFYTLTYVENVGMLLAYYFLTSHYKGYWYHYVVCIVILCGFFIGIFCQVVYYIECHPNNTANDASRPPIRIGVRYPDLTCIKKGELKVW